MQRSAVRSSFLWRQLKTQRKNSQIEARQVESVAQPERGVEETLQCSTIYKCRPPLVQTGNRSSLRHMVRVKSLTAAIRITVSIVQCSLRYQIYMFLLFSPHREFNNDKRPFEELWMSVSADVLLSAV